MLRAILCLVLLCLALGASAQADPVTVTAGLTFDDASCAGCIVPGGGQRMITSSPDSSVLVLTNNGPFPLDRGVAAATTLPVGTLSNRHAGVGNFSGSQINLTLTVALPGGGTTSVTFIGTIHQTSQVLYVDFGGPAQTVALGNGETLTFETPGNLTLMLGRQDGERFEVPVRFGGGPVSGGGGGPVSGGGSPVPEPGTLILLGLGLLGGAAAGRRARSRKDRGGSGSEV